MRRGLKCPKCRNWIATDERGADGRVICHGCRSTYRLEPKAHSSERASGTGAEDPNPATDEDESSTIDDEMADSVTDDDFADLDLNEFDDSGRSRQSALQIAESNDENFESDLPSLRQANRKSTSRKASPANKTKSSKKKTRQPRHTSRTLRLAAAGTVTACVVMAIGFGVWKWATAERAPASSRTPSRYTIITKVIPIAPALPISGRIEPVEENNVGELRPLPPPTADVANHAREALLAEHRANSETTHSNASLQEQYPPRRQRLPGQRRGLVPSPPVVPESWRPLPRIEVVRQPVLTWGTPATSGFYSCIWVTSEKEIAKITSRNPRPITHFRNRQRSSQGSSAPSRRNCAVFYEPVTPEGGVRDKPVSLYDYSQQAAVVDLPLEGLRRAALSWDGKFLAVNDLAGFGADVDIFNDTGEVAGGFIPYGADVCVDWIGWDREDRLLTVGGGRLTSWDVPDFAAQNEVLTERFEIDGSYRPPVVWAPGRAWVAASAGSYVDLLDPETGTCLGRIGAPHNGVVIDVAVQNDGSHAAVLYQSPEQASILISDLQTGQNSWLRLNFADKPATLNGMSYVDRDRLAIWGRGCAVVDAATGRLAESFHGFRVDNIAFRRVIPDQYVSILYAPPGTPERELLDGPAIRLEVDTPDDSQNARIAQALATKIRDLGYRFGDNGFALRVTGLIGGGDTIGLQSIGKSVTIPGVTYRWELFNPFGHLAWKTEAVERYSGDVQRFMSRTDGRGRKAVIQEFRVDMTRLREDAMKDIMSRTPALPTIPTSVFFDERATKRPDDE